MRATDLPIRYNAADILERNLPERADKTALLSVEREATYAELAAEAARVGNALRGLDVRPGEVVAILAPDSVEWATTFFGTLKVGAVALGVNTLLKPHDYAFALRDSRARVIIVHESLLPAVERSTREIDSLEHIVVLGDSAPAGARTFAEWIDGQPEQLDNAPTQREDICSLNYSSGTTGEPKGIPHAHKDYPLSARLWGVHTLGLGEEDRTFAAPKLFFTFALGGNLIFPLYVGASAVLLSGPAREASRVLETIGRFRPTILYHAPTGYAGMMAVEDFVERHDLSSLRMCVSAGEALPAPVWDAWKKATDLDIIDGIGSTENFHIFLSNRPGDIRPGSSGKPVDGYELRLVDEDEQDVPEGEIGNLWVKGETVALAYLHRYETSKKTFRGEWLVTGDKYYRDAEGYYWHAGRSDDMLKVGGIWVSPVEVESVLLSHPAVLECAVIGAQDDSELIKPKAMIVLNEGFEPNTDLRAGLVKHCKDRMAEFKRPRWIEFLDDLPKTGTGKVQRFKLRES